MRTLLIVLSALLFANTLQAQHNYNLGYLRAKWEIIPAFRNINGACTYKYSISRRNGFAQDTLRFELHNNLRVDSIKTGNFRRTFFRSNRNELFIISTAPLNAIDSISIFYQGPPGNTGFGSFVMAQHAGVPIVWTINPPYGAKDWFPAKQTLNDKIDSCDIFITVPNNNRAAGPGKLISVVPAQNGFRTFHWKHRHPAVSYLIATAITNYVSYDDTAILRGRAVPITNFVYPENEQLARARTPATIPIIQLYDSLFDPYPFADEKYGHAQFGFSGGMENQTMSHMGDFSRSLIAHELAHQWFGNQVTCASFKDMWLNEGFATFTEGLVISKFDGNEAYKNWRLEKNNLITSQNGGSVFVRDTSTFTTIYSYRLTYTKGAMLLDMIRRNIGDAAFFPLLQEWLRRYNHSFASVPNFIQLLNERTGSNWQPWFDRWYYAEGHPIISGSLQRNSNDAYFVELSQRNSANVNNLLYTDSIPVHFNYASGRRFKLKLLMNSSSQLFTIPIPDSLRNDVLLNASINDDAELIAQRALLTSIEGTNLKNAAKILVYPNPSKDGVVNFKAIHQTAELKVYNANGALVLSSSISEQKPFVSLKNHPKGVYFIHLEEFNKRKHLLRVVME